MSSPVEISRTNPTCLVFLLDQSHSMDGGFGGQPGKKKAEGVSDAINRLLQNLVLKCAKADGVRDYFHVGVIGYGVKMGSAFGGKLAGKPLIPISEIANNPIRVEQRKKTVDDGAGGLIEQTVRFPVWIEPRANGKTPMCAALERAGQTIDTFLTLYPDCYPPMVLNLTDGKPSDGNPLGAAQSLCGLASSVGNVVLFNAHISSKAGPAIVFPSEEEGLPDNYAKLLFRVSSMLPPHLREAARGEGFAIDDGSRGFVFNGDLVSIIRFLEIGTRVSSALR